MEAFRRRPARALGLLTLLLVIIALVAPAGTVTPVRAASGGPLILMGIDAEDGGIGGHGPITIYQSVANDILSNVTNGGSGILVIGGGKSVGDHVTTFWNALAAGTGQSVTYVNGGAIAGQSFAGFAMIGVVSDEINTPFGGLTQTENNLLAARAADIAAHVNNGGGLLGFSSDFPNAYAYLAGVGSFSANTGLSFSDITPTAAGTAIGITDALDICCWHDEFSAFPPFLQVLATNALTGNAVTVGGADVFISSIQLAPDAATNPVGASHTLTATVEENGSPVSGATVTFTVISGPHAGTTGTGTTDASGIATFAYTGAALGIDTIEASYVDSQGNSQTSNQVTKEWFGAPPDAVDDAASTPKNVAVQINALANDSDPDGDPVSVVAVDATSAAGGTVSDDGGGLVTYTPPADFIGTDTFTYAISDPGGLTDTATVAVDVFNQPPDAVDDLYSTVKNATIVLDVLTNDSDPDVGDSIAISAVDTAGTLGGTIVDNGDGTLTYTAPGVSGTDTFTYTIVDESGATDTATVTVDVVNQPPDCSAATPSVSVIWSPNHQFVAVEVLGVTDPDGDPITITITGISQDEPTDTTGDGSFVPDAMGVGTSVAEVRAERSGNPNVPGDGRFYHIFYTADDGDGGTCSGEVIVVVPHDQGANSVPVDQGAIYDSTV
jgi:hypothetical protein